MAQHECEHTCCSLGIAGIFRAVQQILVVVVDLPKELAIDELEAAEVVLTMRIVVLRELVKGRNELKYFRLHHVGQFGDTTGHHDLAARERPPEGVVEITNTFGTFFDLCVHGGLLNEASQNKAAHHSRSPAGLAVSLSLVSLHFSNCGASH